MRLASSLVRSGNDVIGEADSQQFPGVFDCPGKPPVGLAGAWVARWVIVHENDSVGGGHDRRAEDFAGVCNGFVFPRANFLTVSGPPKSRCVTGQAERSTIFRKGGRRREPRAAA